MYVERFFLKVFSGIKEGNGLFGCVLSRFAEKWVRILVIYKRNQYGMNEFSERIFFEEALLGLLGVTAFFGVPVEM